MLSKDIHKVVLFISNIRGLLPDNIIEFTLATKVFVGTNIVLFFIPNARIETSRADVQEFVAIPCLEPTSFENLSSNSATYFP